MRKLIAIGELLIDFIGVQNGGMADITTFERNAGGAPANVAVCVARLGGTSRLLTKLGNDAFGDYLYDVMKEYGVLTDGILRTDKANTPLAFVALDKNGERDFTFYRKPSSDLLLDASEINPDFFEKDDILHFCSVDLVDYPVRTAHDKAIELARKKGGLISFDFNLRYPLWDSKKILHETVNRYVDSADIIKAGEDELLAVTDANSEREAVKKLFRGNVKLVLVTHGKNGATAYFDDLSLVMHSGIKDVKQIDATGAGDTFIGTFLYQLLSFGDSEQDYKSILKDKQKIKDFLFYANKAAAITITRRGALSSLPTKNEVFYKVF